MPKDKKKSTDLVSVQPEMLRYVDKADLASWDYDALVEAGRGVGEVKTYSSWLLGKLGNAIVTSPTNKFGDLTNYAKDINQDYGTLQQYVNAYKKFTAEDPSFTPDKYFGQVPWGMLQMIATKSDKPIELLNELIDKGVRTQEHAYRELKQRETGQEVPRKPRIQLKWNTEVKKWQITLKPEDLDLIDWSNVKGQLMSYLNSLM